MSQMNAANTQTTDMSNVVTNYAVPALNTDGPQNQEETEWMNTKWAQQLGYYKTIPEIQKAVDALALWAVGKGFTADPETKVILENIIGNGADTINTILKNLVVTCQISGDAYLEIIRDPNVGELINLKPIDPGSMKIIVNRQGKIKRYAQVNKIPNEDMTIVKFEPREILHLCRNRIADEIHGISIIEAVEWVILAKNEAMADQKRLMHRNVVPIKIWEVDTDDTTKLTAFKAKVDDAVKNFENLVVPKGSATATILATPANSTLNPMPWIEYLDNFFWQAVGVPKVVAGGSQEFTEATAKIAYLTFQQTWSGVQKEIESQFWKQLALRIDFIEPASLENEMLSDQSKDSGQMNTQINPAGMEE